VTATGCQRCRLGPSWTRSIQEGLPVIGIIAALRRHPPALVLGALLALAVLPLPARAAVATADTAAAPAPAAPAEAPRRSNGNPSAPVAISTPPPEFPGGARRSNKAGYVVVNYTVGTDGRVGNVRIVESSPRGVFDHAVQSALARWRFQPPSTPREVTHTFYFDE
jgi:TonB family protein